MTDPAPRIVLLQLSENDALGSLAVDAENFDRFEQEFEGQLGKLIDTWKLVASPNAQNIRRSIS